MQNYSVKSIKWQGVQKSAMPLRLDYDQSTHKLCFSWSGYFSKLARTPSLISHTFFFNLMKMFPSDIGFYLSTCGLQTHKQQAGKISSPECLPLHRGWPAKLQMQRPGPGQGLGSRPQGAERFLEGQAHVLLFLLGGNEGLDHWQEPSCLLGAQLGIPEYQNQLYSNVSTKKSFWFEYKWF